MLDYQNRLKQVRTKMAENNIGLMFLNVGANLFFLTGLRRGEVHLTDVNAYGDWACGAFITQEEGILLTAPRMSGRDYPAEVGDKPWFKSVKVIVESEDPMEVLRHVLSRYPLQGKKIVLDNRVWAEGAIVFKKLLPDNEFVTANELIAPLRMIKGEEELALMRKTGLVTDAIFQKALARLKPGVSEYDVANEIDYQVRLQGGEMNSFATGVSFVSLGKDRDETYRASLKTLERGCSITFDFGVVVDGYASDFGRSAFCGNPSSEYLKVHEIVLRAQSEAMKAMKAEQLTCAQADAIARKVIVDEGYGPHFVHRLGHGIGITVHEPPYLDYGQDIVLKKGMTFTVEPSICVPDQFRNRVEDVVVVTDTGAVSLYTTSHKLTIID